MVKTSDRTKDADVRDSPKTMPWPTLVAKRGRKSRETGGTSPPEFDVGTLMQIVPSDFVMF